MKARLAKDGARILCRMLDCGAVLGAVYNDRLPPHAEIVSAKTGWVHLAPQGTQGFVVLRPGYRSDPDGVFRITRAADKRRRHGAPMRVGGRMSSERPHDPVPAAEMGVKPCCLPRKVACFNCKMVQNLDPVELGVEAVSHRLGVNRAGMSGRVERVWHGPKHSDFPCYWTTRDWRR